MQYFQFFAHLLEILLVMTIDALQIRVCLFDSGPRVHHFFLEINKIAPQGAFYCVRFDRVLLGLKGQGEDAIPVLENGIKRFDQRCRAQCAHWVILAILTPHRTPTSDFEEALSRQVNHCSAAAI